ncbi:MAG: COX15/CtaA family protein [Pseudomonadota bacterium]
MERDAISPTAARWISYWLIVVALMVYAMILIGGATRLTDSGLSITEWQPISGALPPLSQEAWLIELEKYRATTEYQQQNYNMSMSEFQFIYWWEWGHRLFGRLIGLFAVGGFIWFAAKRWLNRKWTGRLLFLIALGGLQGFIGWWMVASGIGETTRVDVAPYRLMTHFGLALFIIAVTAWYWFDLKDKRVEAVGTGTRILATSLMILIFAQMLTGALVAGLDAGRTYTDWPLMLGEFFPSNYVEQGLGILSLFEGRAATQFNHRFLAYIIWGLSLWGAWSQRKTDLAKGFYAIAALVTAQAVWGILTLMNAAPLELALVHQGLGVIVMLVSVRVAWQVTPARARRAIQIPTVSARSDQPEPRGAPSSI